MKTGQYWNFKNGSRKVSFVVDDLSTVTHWAPRAVKIDGTAQLVEDESRPGNPFLRITPLSCRRWGIA